MECAQATKGSKEQEVKATDERVRELQRKPRDRERSRPGGWGGRNFK